MLSQKMPKSAFQNKQLQTTETVIFGQNQQVSKAIMICWQPQAPMSTNQDPWTPTINRKHSCEKSTTFFQALAKLLRYVPIH